MQCVVVDVMMWEKGCCMTFSGVIVTFNISGRGGGNGNLIYFSRCNMITLHRYSEAYENLESEKDEFQS
jgi:hypothetical protein